MVLSLSLRQSLGTKNGQLHLGQPPPANTLAARDKATMESTNGLIRGCHGAGVVGRRQAVIVKDDRCPLAEPKRNPDHTLIVVLFGPSSGRADRPFSVCYGQGPEGRPLCSRLTRKTALSHARGFWLYPFPARRSTTKSGIPMEGVHDATDGHCP